MKSVIILPKAQKSMYEVADWLASEYFLDTGIRFIEEIGLLIFNHAKLNNLIFPLCKNKRLAKRGFSCIIFKDKWVIAFKYSASKFIVHEFIWGAKLK